MTMVVAVSSLHMLSFPHYLSALFLWLGLAWLGLTQNVIVICYVFLRALTLFHFSRHFFLLFPNETHWTLSQWFEHKHTHTHTFRFIFKVIDFAWINHAKHIARESQNLWDKMQKMWKKQMIRVGCSGGENKWYANKLNVIFGLQSSSLSH